MSNQVTFLSEPNNFRGKDRAAQSSFSVGGPVNAWEGLMPSAPRVPMEDIDRRGAVTHVVPTIGDVKSELQKKLPDVLKLWISRPNGMTPITTYLLPKVFSDSLVRTLKTTEFNSDMIGIIPSRAPPPLVGYSSEYQTFTSVRRAQGLMLHHEFWNTASGRQMFNDAMNHIATMLLFTLEAAAGMAILSAQDPKTSFSMLTKKARIATIEDMLALEASSFAAIIKGNDGSGLEALNTLVSKFKSILNNGESPLPPTDIVLPYGLRFHESMRPEERDYSTSGPKALAVRERGEDSFNVVQGIRVHEIQPLRIKNRSPYELNVFERVREIGDHFRAVDTYTANDGSYRTNHRNIRILDLDTALGEIVELTTEDMLKNCGRFDFDTSPHYPLNVDHMRMLANQLNSGDLQQKLQMDPVKEKLYTGNVTARSRARFADPLLYLDKKNDNGQGRWNICAYLGDLEEEYFTGADLENFADHAVRYFKSCRAITEEDVSAIDAGLKLIEELNNPTGITDADLLALFNSYDTKEGPETDKEGFRAWGMGNIYGMRKVATYGGADGQVAQNFNAALKKLWSIACELSPNNPALDPARCPVHWRAGGDIATGSKLDEMHDSITVFGQNLIDENRSNIFIKGSGVVKFSKGRFTATDFTAGKGDEKTKTAKKDAPEGFDDNLREGFNSPYFKKLLRDEPPTNYPYVLYAYFKTSGLEELYRKSKKDGQNRTLFSLLEKCAELARATNGVDGKEIPVEVEEETEGVGEMVITVLEAGLENANTDLKEAIEKAKGKGGDSPEAKAAEEKQTEVDRLTVELKNAKATKKPEKKTKTVKVGSTRAYVLAMLLNYVFDVIVNYDSEKGDVNIYTFSNKRLEQIAQAAEKQSAHKVAHEDASDELEQAEWTPKPLTLSETFWKTHRKSDNIVPASRSYPYMPRMLTQEVPESEIEKLSFVSTKYSVAAQGKLAQPFSSKSKFKFSKGHAIVRHIEATRPFAFPMDEGDDNIVSEGERRQTYFEVSENMNMRYKHATNGTSCSPLHRMFMQLWLFMPINGDQLLRLLKKNMLFPFDFLIERPFIKLHMGSGVMSSGPVGSTVIGNILLESSDDATHQEHMVHFSFHHGTDVFNKRRMIVMRDIYPVGYIAGGGSRYIAPEDLRAQQNRYNNKSLLCFLVPRGSLQNGSPLPRVADVHDWRGRFESNMYADVIPREVALDTRAAHFIGAFFENLRFESLTNSTAHLGAEFGNAEFNIDPAFQNSITWQGHQQHYNPKLGNWSIIVLNKGHLGQHLQAGFRGMLQGGSNRVQKTNNIENSISL